MDADGWTVRTEDGSLSAHFEYTVAVEPVRVLRVLGTAGLSSGRESGRTLMSKKEEAIEVEATVVEPLPNAMFKVELENKHQVLAHISGKMRKNFIRILPGRQGAGGAVAVRPDRGRIIYRYK